MNAFFRALRLSMGLVGLLALFFWLPAIAFGAIAQWPVILLAIAYLGFFLVTVGSAMYGVLAKRLTEPKFKLYSSGRLAFTVQLVILLNVPLLLICR